MIYQIRRLGPLRKHLFVLPGIRFGVIPGFEPVTRSTKDTEALQGIATVVLPWVSGQHNKWSHFLVQ